MEIRYELDTEKAVEVLLYITHGVPNMYRALKMLYFADQKHLERYGRLICGDSYVAMRLGPVPSYTYDMVKAVRGDGFWWTGIPLEDIFRVDGNDIVPLRPANLDLLSESDQECLDETIAECRPLSFNDIIQRSHEGAYQSADRNDLVPIEAIIRSLPDGHLLLEHLVDD